MSTYTPAKVEAKRNTPPQEGLFITYEGEVIPLEGETVLEAATRFKCEMEEVGNSAYIGMANMIIRYENALAALREETR